GPDPQLPAHPGPRDAQQLPGLLGAGHHQRVQPHRAAHVHEVHPRGGHRVGADGRRGPLPGVVADRHAAVQARARRDRSVRGGRQLERLARHAAVQLGRAVAVDPAVRAAEAARELDERRPELREHGEQRRLGRKRWSAHHADRAPLGDHHGGRRPDPVRLPVPAEALRVRSDDRLGEGLTAPGLPHSAGGRSGPQALGEGSTIFRYNPASLLWRTLDALGSIILISLFWLVSLGLVVTAGIGTVIAYELCRRYVLDKDATPWDVAKKAWHQSWKQATVVGLLTVLVAMLGILTVSYIPTLGFANVIVPLLVTGFFLLILLFRCLPLVARLNNPTRRQLRNGLTLGLAPRSSSASPCGTSSRRCSCSPGRSFCGGARCSSASSSTGGTSSPSRKRPRSDALPTEPLAPDGEPPSAPALLRHENPSKGPA